MFLQRKCVTAKCYGGDAQAQGAQQAEGGQKADGQFGKVDIPQEASIDALKMGD
jgi:translation elongation factor EF-4